MVGEKLVVPINRSFKIGTCLLIETIVIVYVKVIQRPAP